MEIFKEINKEIRKEYFKPNEYIDWGWISATPVLSEQFIEKYADKLNWRLISWYQKLSKEFIEKHKDKIDFEALNGNLLYQTNIGKDWFIAYTDYYLITTLPRNNLYLLRNNMHKFKEGLKVQIYYKDLDTTLTARRIKILRKYRNYKIKNSL